MELRFFRGAGLHLQPGGIVGACAMAPGHPGSEWDGEEAGLRMLQSSLNWEDVEQNRRSCELLGDYWS